MNITNICVHHSGGLKNDPLASTQHTKAHHVDAYHKQKWGYISQLGKYGGYTFFINKKGVWTQFRKIGEETIAQRGHNFDTVSICLAGNFNNGVDTPTKAQIDTLRFIMITLLEGRAKDFFKVTTTANIKIGWASIRPHRLWSSTKTQCYGTSLSDKWAMNIVVDYLHEKLRIAKILVTVYIQLLGLYKSLKAKEDMTLGAFAKDECVGFMEFV